MTVWSAFTFLSGLVNSFGQLFTCRAVVGVGEAAYGPAAASLVADYFPARGRAVAMGILSSGIALGGVLGLLLGVRTGALDTRRTAFVVLFGAVSTIPFTLRANFSSIVTNASACSCVSAMYSAS